ncbi:PH domain containing protein [Histomonas meleagridis]|uniref:PH domain containing protein n=1 Tax=Histomonas meleagridis TaxID=135588 RepID=UPI003559704F|nr:PH domain containing protein [Histomonas meleagridis]KAH0798714.1 PH domain containing protein [Histomonas meleagridis]
MNVKDCSRLDFNTWLGPSTPLDAADIPVDKPLYQYPPNFANEFNRNSLATIKNAQSIGFSQYLKNSYDIAPYLFYCQGIHPRAITQFFFSNPSISSALFYYYFSSISLEYLPLADAIRILLSRIAFPADMAKVLVVLDSFADAYYSANSFLCENKNDIVKIALAAIVFTINKKKTKAMSSNTFLSILQNVKSSKEYKLQVYESLKERPIPLFLTFTQLINEPNLDLKGDLVKVGSGSVLKRKKKRLFLLNGYSMQSFKDKEMTELTLNIPLVNVLTQYVPAKGKEPSHFIISSLDNNAFGESFSKNKKKVSKNNSYTFYANDDDEIRNWVYALKLVSFYNSIESLTK